MIAPGLDGVVPVEPDDGGDQAPELIEIGRAQQALSDPLTRAGHERPVHLAAAHRAEQRRRQRHVVCSRPGRVDVCEQRRIGVAPDHDHGASPLDAVGDQPLVPAGDEIEGVSGRVPQPCPLCVLIPVQHGHVAGPRLVGGFRDGTRDRRLLHIHRQDEHVLPGGDVRADLHGQLAQSSRVAVVQRLVHVPRSQGAWITMRLTVQDRAVAEVNELRRGSPATASKPRHYWRRASTVSGSESFVCRGLHLGKPGSGRRGIRAHSATGSAHPQSWTRL